MAGSRSIPACTPAEIRELYQTTPLIKHFPVSIYDFLVSFSEIPVGKKLNSGSVRKNTGAVSFLTLSENRKES
jgi:hypothetical protein